MGKVVIGALVARSPAITHTRRFVSFLYCLLGSIHLFAIIVSIFYIFFFYLVNHDHAGATPKVKGRLGIVCGWPMNGTKS